MKKTMGHLIDTIITCKGKHPNVYASHIDDNLDTVYMCLGVLVRVISLDLAALHVYVCRRRFRSTVQNPMKTSLKYIFEDIEEQFEDGACSQRIPSSKILRI